MRTIIDTIDYAVRNWWISLLVGLLFIILGIVLVFWPAVSYVALSIMFAVLMFLSGIMEIVFAATNRRVLTSWGWYLAGGILDLILGLILIFMPVLSMEVLPFVLAFWLMYRGFTALGYSMDMQRYGHSNWGWILAFGILAILCAFGILWRPVIGAVALVYLVAFTLMIIGILRIMLAFDLRNLHTRNAEVREHVKRYYPRDYDDR